MSYVSKKGIMKKIAGKVSGAGNEYALYWDRGLFKGFYFHFPGTLFSSEYINSNRVGVESFIATVIPKKLPLFKKMVNQFIFDLKKFRRSPEWSEFLSDFTTALKEVFVRPGEVAIITWKGNILEVLEEGSYEIPKKYREQGIEVVMIQTNELKEYYKDGRLISREGLLWGVSHLQGGLTTISDKPEHSSIKVRFGGSGTFILKVTDPLKFYREVISGRDLPDITDLVEFFRGEIQNTFIRQLGMRPYNVIMENIQYLGEAVVQDDMLIERLNTYGIQLTEFYIKAIIPDPSRKEFIDKILYGDISLDAAVEIEEARAKQRLEEEKSTVRADKKHCLSCGVELPRKAKFCIECGEKLI